jgi:hypothetical protein
MILCSPSPGTLESDSMTFPNEQIVNILIIYGSVEVINHFTEKIKMKHQTELITTQNLQSNLDVFQSRVTIQSGTDVVLERFGQLLQELGCRCNDIGI